MIYLEKRRENSEQITEKDLGARFEGIWQVVRTSGKILATPLQATSCAYVLSRYTLVRTSHYLEQCKSPF